MVKLDQLMVFAAVVKHGGFIAAANAIHRSQPAVSSSVKKLEETIGFQLFERDQYRVSLTEKGKQFHQLAVTTLDKFSTLVSSANNIRDGIETEIGIVLDNIIDLNDYLTLFQQVAANYPNTRFEFYTEVLSGNTQRLLLSQADIAICVNHAENVDLELINLIPIEMLSVTSPQYANNHQQQLSDPERISECLQIILRDSAANDQKQCAGVLGDAPTWVVSDITSRKQMIVAGIGWGRLPIHEVRQELAAGQLVMLSNELFPPVKLNLCALRKKSHIHGPVANAIWNGLQEKYTI